MSPDLARDFAELAVIFARIARKLQVETPPQSKPVAPEIANYFGTVK